MLLSKISCRNLQCNNYLRANCYLIRLVAINLLVTSDRRRFAGLRAGDKRPSTCDTQWRPRTCVRSEATHKPLRCYLVVSLPPRPPRLRTSPQRQRCQLLVSINKDISLDLLPLHVSQRPNIYVPYSTSNCSVFCFFLICEFKCRTLGFSLHATIILFVVGLVTGNSRYQLHNRISR